MGVKIGSSAIVHPFTKCTCSQEGNAQGKDDFPNSEIQIFLNVSKFYPLHEKVGSHHHHHHMRLARQIIICFIYGLAEAPRSCVRD